MNRLSKGNNFIQLCILNTIAYLDVVGDGIGNPIMYLKDIDGKYIGFINVDGKPEEYTVIDSLEIKGVYIIVDYTNILIRSFLKE